jgi:hypothetical protein
MRQLLETTVNQFNEGLFGSALVSVLVVAGIVAVVFI